MNAKQVAGTPPVFLQCPLLERRAACLWSAPSALFLCGHCPASAGPARAVAGEHSPVRRRFGSLCHLFRQGLCCVMALPGSHFPASLQPGAAPALCTVPHPATLSWYSSTWALPCAALHLAFTKAVIWGFPELTNHMSSALLLQQKIRSVLNHRNKTSSSQENFDLTNDKAYWPEAAARN